MRRCVAALTIVVCLAGLVNVASAHRARGKERACGVLSGVSSYGPVGVSAQRVSCSVARQVARGSVRRQRFERWRCGGLGTRFGHCHGKGIRRGGTIYWYAYH